MVSLVVNKLATDRSVARALVTQLSIDDGVDHILDVTVKLLVKNIETEVVYVIR